MQYWFNINIIAKYIIIDKFSNKYNNILLRMIANNTIITNKPNIFLIAYLVLNYISIRIKDENKKLTKIISQNPNHDFIFIIQCSNKIVEKYTENNISR